MYGPYILLFVTLLFVVLSAVIAVRFYWKYSRNSDIRLPRNSLGSGYHIFAQQTVVLAIVILFAVLGVVDLYDLGASRTFHPALAFLVGFGVYFVVLAVIEGFAFVSGSRDRLHDLSFETMRLIWPRDPQQKILAFVAVCIINPFTEEVIYRGVLIHYLGGLIDNMFIAALIGFVLSIAAHMYQGSWSIPFQMMFHGAAIALLVSPVGLIACFGFHVAGDLVPVVLLRRSMIEWRERRRRERGLTV